MSDNENEKKYKEILKDASVSIGTWDFSGTRKQKYPEVGKVAAVGEKELVSVFKTVGADVFPVTDAVNTAETLKDLTERDYSVILMTEKAASQAAPIIEALNGRCFPIILNMQNGMERLQKIIHKAVGTV